MLISVFLLLNEDLQVIEYIRKYCHVYGVNIQGFELVIGFIELFNTQLMNTLHRSLSQTE
jgi:hypothetical protein